MPPPDERTRRALAEGIARGASDWHFTPGARLKIRVEGDLEDLKCDEAPWDASAILQSWVTVTGQPIATVTASSLPETDDRSIAVADVDGKTRRFRVHAKRMLGGLGYNLRALADEPMKLTELNTPPLVVQLCKTRSSGIILFCGATGEGKSSSQTAVIDEVLRAKKVKVVTFESPIEVVIPNSPEKKGLIQQHEVPDDLSDFSVGARSALRDDPDIVLFGELRDDEAIHQALLLGKTGHLVFGTLHTGNSFESISRLMAARPKGAEESYLQELAQTVVAVLCQRLIKGPTGKRIANYELLVIKQGVAGVIMRGDFKQLPNAMSNGAADGMFSFDDHLIELIKDEKLTVECALAGVPTPRDTITHFVTKRLITPSDEQKLRKIHAV